MRKIYFLLSFAFLASTAMAQIDVTFAVDMSGETVSANGVHVAGDWQSEANGGEDWQPGVNEMLDGDGDGIYTLTVSIPAGGYAYKYINDNDWVGVESVPAVSQIGGNDNRYFQLTDLGSSLDTVPFSGSAMPGLSAVKLIVDMADVTVEETGAHVAGDMFNPQWTPNATPLFKQNDGNNLWIVVVQVADGDYQYKFLRSNDWGTDESVPDDCGAGGNRTITVAGDMEEGPNCFGACGPCAVATDITFKVDMNQACMDLTDGVNLMGTVTDWGTGAPMDDSDGDGVYELTVGLQPGDYEYKFRVGGDGWEGIDNRPLTVVEGESQTLDPVCFGSADVCPSEFWGLADVTFNCDVNGETVPDGQFVWVMGGFTSPTWQAGAIQMSDDDGDGIWSVTFPDYCPQNGVYKFVIGLDNTNTGSDWLEEDAEFSTIGGCGVPNGDFSDNRFFERTSNDAVTLCYAFNTCDACLVGIEELESLNRVEIYPNPVVGDINIVFENSGKYNIRLLDVTGKVILTEEVNASQTVIGSDDLNSGVYFIQITDNDNNTITRKIVK